MFVSKKVLGCCFGISVNCSAALAETIDITDLLRSDDELVRIINDSAEGNEGDGSIVEAHYSFDESASSEAWVKVNLRHRQKACLRNPWPAGGETCITIYDHTTTHRVTVQFDECKSRSVHVDTSGFLEDWLIRISAGKRIEKKIKESTDLCSLFDEGMGK